MTVQEIMDKLKKNIPMTDGSFVFTYDVSTGLYGYVIPIVFIYAKDNLDGYPVRIVPSYEWEKEIKDQASQFYEYIETPEKQPMKLYRIELYDQMKGRGWVWARNVDHAYEIGRECENNGDISAEEFISSEIEVWEEENPASIHPDQILNPEDKND